MIFSHEKALEALEKYYVAKKVFAELDQMCKADEKWGAKASLLKELVEHHVKEEKSDVFALAKKVLPNEQMEEVLHAFEKEKQMMQKTMKKGQLSHA